MRFLFFILILLSITCSSYGQQTDDRGYIVKVGDNVKDIQLKLTSGETLRLYDLKGKVVVLQFTASWCSVCRKEMPHLENEIWLTSR